MGPGKPMKGLSLWVAEEQYRVLSGLYFKKITRSSKVYRTGLLGMVGGNGEREKEERRSKAEKSRL